MTTIVENDRISWAGMSIVLISAAALSFAQLMELAIECGFDPQLAWLLPITIDFGEAVACRVWLRRHTPRAAARFAGVMTWGLLVTTIVANGVGHGLASASMHPPWWVAVAVGAIPPLVVGLSVHLMMLVSRPAEDDAPEDEPEVEPPPGPLPVDAPAPAVPLRKRPAALEQTRPVRVVAEVDPDDEPEPENETPEERGKRLARNRSRRARRRRAAGQGVEMQDEA